MYKPHIVFDLDDTLYKEIDFYKSGVTHVYRTFCKLTLGSDSVQLDLSYNWLDEISTLVGVDKRIVLDEYRYHMPNIKLSTSNLFILKDLKKSMPISLITDGRSRTQRNKIKVLELDYYFKHIVISDEIGSEKPNLNNFLKIIENDTSNKYFYVGDNPSKDFLGPNKLGWTSICLLDNGQNIHPQNFEISDEYLPMHKISSLEQVFSLI
jgi:putative hydrolase of the HAD superfamily